MFRRFIEWLKRLFLGDSDRTVHLENVDAQETTESEKKIDVVSCEVISISFEDDDEEKTEDFVYDFEV